MKWIVLYYSTKVNLRTLYRQQAKNINFFSLSLSLYFCCWQKMAFVSEKYATAGTYLTHTQLHTSFVWLCMKNGWKLPVHWFDWHFYWHTVTAVSFVVLVLVVAILVVVVVTVTVKGFMTWAMYEEAKLLSQYIWPATVKIVKFRCIYLHLFLGHALFIIHKLNVFRIPQLRIFYYLMACSNLR